MDTLLAKQLVCQGPVQWQRPEQLLWLLALGPLLEEWVIRAGLQEALLRRAAPPASRLQLYSVLLSSLAFCVMHAGRGWTTILFVAPFSLLVGIIYVCKRSWLACASLHAACNLVVWTNCRQNF